MYLNFLLVVMLEETYKREYTKERPEITNVKDIIIVVRGIVR
jgi:hypothetical protein